MVSFVPDSPPEFGVGVKDFDLVDKWPVPWNEKYLKQDR
jgi:hypothetical protein